MNQDNEKRNDSFLFPESQGEREESSHEQHHASLAPKFPIVVIDDRVLRRDFMFDR